MPTTTGQILTWDGTLAAPLQYKWADNAAAAGWEDLQVNTFAPRVSAPTLAVFGAHATYPVSSWSFANNNTERGLDSMIQIPHAAMSTEKIYLHMHLSTTGAIAAGTDVGLFASIRVQKRGATANFEGVYWCKKSPPGGGFGAKEHISTEDVEIDLTQAGGSAMIWIYTFRHKGTVVATANAGNVTENVNDVIWLHQLDFHVKRSTFGSPTTTPTW